VPDFLARHSRQWIDHFARQGYDVVPLAAGVEGAVYDLGAGLIAKVWRERRAADLTLMQGFYAEVAAAGLPFGTPEILRIEQAGGTAVSYERKFPGRPLQDVLGPEDTGIRADAARCVVGVLAALAAVPATASMRRLAVLDEDRPLWAGAARFAGALAGLLSRRSARFGPVIRARLPDFDRRYAALEQCLTALGDRPDTVVHGDLFGANILVDGQLRPLAVLDFGFLTTAGDPCFDAAITASIMNMYGPHAAEITRDLTARIARELSYRTEVLLVYQAAYAVATSNAFTTDGSDGHFAWCLAQLARPDIMEALGL
jgi:aminoglycoside phosphotransferase (APT) family kinase protein